MNNPGLLSSAARSNGLCLSLLERSLYVNMGRGKLFKIWTLAPAVHVAQMESEWC